MSANFQIPLGIPDVEILSIKNGERGELILTVKSTLDYTYCRHCQRKITTTHGYDRPIRLQHLPIFEHKVYIELHPKCYRCLNLRGYADQDKPQDRVNRQLLTNNTWELRKQH